MIAVEGPMEAFHSAKFRWVVCSRSVGIVSRRGQALGQTPMEEAEPCAEDCSVMNQMQTESQSAEVTGPSHTAPWWQSRPGPCAAPAQASP